MAPNAGKPSMGGRAEREGTKGYAPDDRPLRDGHVEEPDVVVVELDDLDDGESPEAPREP